jgi:dihydroorotate dehydrogenase
LYASVFTKFAAKQQADVYTFVKKIFFLLPAEKAHNLVFKMIKSLFKIPGITTLFKKKYQINNKSLRREYFGLQFKNPVGLAAGLDKDAILINELDQMGFGFIEIGTLTPQPQPGNPKPRLFRLKADHALINRMGFNNQGVDNAVHRLKKVNKDIVIGGNIGKNKATANEMAYHDYLQCFEALFPYVHYFAINVSSPNTPGLRSLQEKEPLTKIINQLKQANQSKKKPKPIFLKIAPDLTTQQLDDIVEIIESTNLEGIIATNTTIGREGLKSSSKRVEAIGAGGLSGKPVFHVSNTVIKYLRKKKPDLFIIGVGGITEPRHAIEKIKAGANLVQLYTGFIYRGPALVKAINKALLTHNF